MLTMKAVNKAIKEAGFDEIELVRGNGYFYFASTSDGMHWIDKAYSASVYVTKLNDLRLDRWISELQHIHVGTFGL